MKKYSISAVLLCLGIFLCPLAARLTVREVSTPLAGQVLRLHVLANSNSEEDQALKLRVKAAVTDTLAPVLGEAVSKEQAVSWVLGHLEQLRRAAQETVLREGYSYPVSVALETAWFPDRLYGDMTFPCGYYDALRVRIGDAKGKNWWCVLYPPLCFVDLACGTVPDESKEKLQTVLDEDDYNRLFAPGSRPVIRFRLLDWLTELFS